MQDHCTVIWVLHPGGEARYYLSLVQVHDINTAQLREPGSCKRSAMPKLRKMSKVNYKQEDEIINSPHRNTGIQYIHSNMVTTCERFRSENT